MVALDCLLDRPNTAWPRQTVWDTVAALEGVEAHRVDLRFDPLEPALEEVEVIFHLAAMTGLHTEVDRSLYDSCNVEATGRLISACAAVGIPRFIHASTSSVYGVTATGGEGSPLQPVSDYGQTKLEAEETLRAVSASSGAGLTILRLFSVFGPGQRPDMAYYRIIEAALHDRPFEVFGDGEQARSNTYVDDVVEGLIGSTGEAAIGETMNIAGGETVSLNQAVATIERLTGREVKRVSRPSRPGDQRLTEGDWSKAHDLIGFEPRTSFEDGIARQIEWQGRLSRP